LILVAKTQNIIDKTLFVLYTYKSPIDF